MRKSPGAKTLLWRDPAAWAQKAAAKHETFSQLSTLQPQHSSVYFLVQFIWQPMYFVRLAHNDSLHFAAPTDAKWRHPPRKTPDFFEGVTKSQRGITTYDKI